MGWWAGGCSNVLNAARLDVAEDEFDDLEYLAETLKEALEDVQDAHQASAAAERLGAVVGVRGRLFEVGHVVVLTVYAENLLRALERGERAPRLEGVRGEVVGGEAVRWW